MCYGGTVARNIFRHSANDKGEAVIWGRRVARGNGDSRTAGRPPRNGNWGESL